MTGMFAVAGGVIIGLIVVAYVSHGGNPLRRDATDGKKRSGLVIYTDYGTGCQYVATMMGGLSPRLDKNGKPICIKDETK